MAANGTYTDYEPGDERDPRADAMRVRELGEVEVSMWWPQALLAAVAEEARASGLSENEIIVKSLQVALARRQTPER